MKVPLVPGFKAAGFVSAALKTPGSEEAEGVFMILYEPQTNILLVDDEADWLNWIEKRLKDLSAVTHRASNGLEALRLLRKHRFDLVITDTHMPYMDGVSLLSYLRSRRAEIPVIVFFSGLVGGDLNPEELEKIGASAVLEKKHAKTRLLPLVKKMLFQKYPG